MKILVLYRMQTWRPQRKTIEDHLQCFGRYLDEAEVYYCNVLTGLPSYLRWIDFDGIIMHTTLMDRDPRLPRWWKHISKQLAPIGQMAGVKIGLPQDDWENTKTLWELFRLTGTKVLFTPIASDHFETIYPKRESGVDDCHTTLCGYVDDTFQSKAAALAQEITDRPIDIGFRVRHMGYLCGRLGTIKHALVEKFDALKGQTALKIDVSDKGSDVIYGDDWIRFLLRCRVMLGCPGGSSLLDLDGSIREKVEAYVKQHPEATYEQVEEACFKGKEGSICVSAISPRHFECAITRTCQVLIEGSYSGDQILRPGVHYIELKRDFSNLSDVLAQVADERHCQTIAARAYQDLVASNRYTYRAFAHEVFETIKRRERSPQPAQPLRSRLVGGLLRIRRWRQWERLRWRAWYLWHISLRKWQRSTS